MADLGGTRLFGNNSQQFPFQAFDLSPNDVFHPQNLFGFSPGTSPAPNHVKNEGLDTFFNSQNRLLDLGRSGYLCANDLQFPPSPKKRQCLSRQAQVLHPPSRLEIPPATNKEKHGQLTPPSETTPTGGLLSNISKDVRFGGPEARTPAGPNTRKRRTLASSQPSKPPAQPTKESSRRKKSRKQTSGEPAAGVDDKRNQFLERNRIAASKCRQKKKEWTSNLEQRGRELQANKTSLNMLVSSLREELLYLKGEALKHTTCDCRNVREYLARPSTTSFAQNYLDTAPSPASGSNLSFIGPDSSIIHDSPLSSAMADRQDLAELGILGELPD